MNRLLIVIILLVPVSVLGQKKVVSQAVAPSVAGDKVPAIPDALRARLFKVQAQQLSAQLELKSAQADVESTNQAWQQVTAEIAAACGNKYLPQWNKDKDPVCAARPEPKQPTEKK